ncbi:hypothetical protein MHH33_03115 [Paenisporosarcina sp. FSL H8-0542]|uniref:hypothetical protein n=1 Tax=unclassified Paenisporosarcina TaxID=2642018 RepID=UPI00034E7C1E|nr:hypothetical protein [Paenisporosarcina sp. HGH0030]EPD50122.1 hypothetical protein HMPREF1210_02970 [Paenisporosarcina sp. HGH0030]
MIYKYFKDSSGEYLGIREEYTYYVFIPVNKNNEEIITLFENAKYKINDHYQKNKEEIHQMKMYLDEDPSIVDRINAIKNYQSIFSISHEKFLSSYPG